MPTQLEVPWEQRRDYVETQALDDVGIHLCLSEVAQNWMGLEFECWRFGEAEDGQWPAGRSNSCGRNAATTAVGAACRPAAIDRYAASTYVRA